MTTKLAKKKTSKLKVKEVKNNNPQIYDPSLPIEPQLVPDSTHKQTLVHKNTVKKQKEHLTFQFQESSRQTIPINSNKP